MRRLLVIATATALFVSVAVGIAGASETEELPWEAWTGKVTGNMVATNLGFEGLTVDLSAVTRPTVENWTKARGQGYYEFDGNAFRLRVTHACNYSGFNTVTVWGPAKVKSGSFHDGEFVKGYKGYAVLSLLDEGDGVVSARAGFFDYDDDDGIFTMIAQQCEYPDPSAVFPATGSGELVFEAK